MALTATLHLQDSLPHPICTGRTHPLVFLKQSTVNHFRTVSGSLLVRTHVKVFDIARVAIGIA